MSHLVLSSLGTTTTATPTSRSPHTNHSTPYNQNSITSNRSSPVPKNSVNSRIIPQTMNPPIDMKSNNILNPEKDADTSRGDHLESKASSISSASGTTTTNNNNVSNNNSTGKTQIVFIHKLYDMLHDESISHLIWRFSKFGFILCNARRRVFSSVVPIFQAHEYCIIYKTIKHVWIP